MKMKVVKVGADRFDARTIGFYVKLVGREQDLPPMLRALAGSDTEVEVEIKPNLRFAVGDLVHYSSIIGEPPTLLNQEIADGPFAMGDTLCWKLKGKSGVVADAALTPAVAHR